LVPDTLPRTYNYYVDNLYNATGEDAKYRWAGTPTNGVLFRYIAALMSGGALDQFEYKVLTKTTTIGNLFMILATTNTNNATKSFRNNFSIPLAESMRGLIRYFGKEPHIDKYSDLPEYFKNSGSKRLGCSGLAPVERDAFITNEKARISKMETDCVNRFNDFDFKRDDLIYILCVDLVLRIKEGMFNPCIGVTAKAKKAIERNQKKSKERAESTLKRQVQVEVTREEKVSSRNSKVRFSKVSAKGYPKSKAGGKSKQEKRRRKR
jgi:hypothetical protein